MTWIKLIFLNLPHLSETLLPSRSVFLLKHVRVKLLTKYDSQEIGGVLGLKNAGDLLYDVAPKDIELIQPPYMPNIRFSKFTLTNELICWGRFGVDPDNFKVARPTFFIHKSQME